MNQITKLSFIGICMAFVVIALGAWTRLVDAGLGCPDWPGCYGFIVFPTNEAEIAIAESRYPMFPYDINKAIPEVVHRYFAAALGLIAIFLVYFSYKFSKDRSIKDITDNLKTITDIPKNILDKDFPKEIDIRGEVFIQNSDFKKISKILDWNIFL